MLNLLMKRNMSNALSFISKKIVYPLEIANSGFDILSLLIVLLSENISKEHRGLSRVVSSAYNMELNLSETRWISFI